MILKYFFFFLLLVCNWNVLLGQPENDNQTQLKEVRLKKGIEQLHNGSYDVARITLEKLVSQEDRAIEPLIEVYLCTGAYNEALELANTLITSEDHSLRGKLLRGEVYMILGRYTEAKISFLEAYSQKSDDIISLSHLGNYYYTIGNSEKYLEYFGQIFDQYDPDQNYSAEELTHIAHACRIYAMKSDETDRSDTLKTIIQEILPAAIKNDPYHFPAYQEMTEILLDAFSFIDAKTTLEEALKLNPHQPFILYTQAKFQAAQYALKSKVLESLEHCLKIHPKMVQAMALSAAICLSDEEYTLAQKHIESALAINPNNLEALSVQAAIYYMQNRETAYQEQCKKILEINPKYGELYFTVASMIGHKRQFSTGVDLNRKAIELDPYLWHAHIELGMSLMRTGNIEEATKQFQKIREEYNFHTQSHNMLLLLNKYKEFKVYKTKNFKIRLHISEADAIEPLLSKNLEKGFSILSQQYQFSPPTPILFELFPSHDDFSVRTIGLDSLGASGACFGQVVVAVSPKSRKLGYFNWASVAWHELTHVFTLYLSNFQVPRWFTEGLSEFSEFQRNSSNQRKHDSHLYAAYSSGKMRGMAKLNAGFTRPDYAMEISICYYQAGLICQYITEKYSFNHLVQMLHLYRQGKSDAEVFSIAFKLTLEEFDQQFIKWLKNKIFDRIKVFPYITEENFEELKDIIEESPTIENYTKLAIAYLQYRRLADAENCAGEIARLNPNLAVSYDIIGQIAFHKGNVAKAQRNLEKAISLGSEQFDTLHILGMIYHNQKKIDLAISTLEKAKKSYPNFTGENNPYVVLAKIYKAYGQREKFFNQIEGYIQLEGSDFKVRVDVAKEYIKEKKYPRAIELLNEALDIYPLEPEVHELLGKSANESKQWELAIQSYTILVSLNKKKAAEYNNDLAEIYLTGLNDKDKAKFYAEEALRIQPDFSPAKKILEKIK